MEKLDGLIDGLNLELSIKEEIINIFTKNTSYTVLKIVYDNIYSKDEYNIPILPEEVHWNIIHDLNELYKSNTPNKWNDLFNQIIRYIRTYKCLFVWTMILWTRLNEINIETLLNVFDLKYNVSVSPFSKEYQVLCMIHSLMTNRHIKISIDEYTIKEI